jgi:hypothetical protein
MREFVLTARNDTDSREWKFQSENDRTALVDATMYVMEFAYPNQEPWANGHIELINDLGVVLAEMESKGDAQ